MGPPEPSCGKRAGRMNRWSVVLAGLVTAALSGIAFVPAWRAGFAYKDVPLVVENPTVTEPGPWYRFFYDPSWPKQTSASGVYRPLTTLSFRLNTILARGAAPDPQAFRLVNMALHALTAIGVVLLAYRLTGRAAAGWVAGALFATHPLHTEAVVMGGGRSDLLAGLFGVWLLARHVRPPGDKLRRSFRFHLASTALFLAAIMSSERGLFLWPALLLIDLWHRRQTPAGDRPAAGPWLRRTLGPAHLGFALACAAFFLLRLTALGTLFHRVDLSRTQIWENPLLHAGGAERLLTPFRLLWLTVELCVRPGRLCPIWSIPALPLADHVAWDVVAGMLLLALLLALIGVLWRRRSPTGVLIAGMLVVLAACVQVWPLGHGLFAEQWLYLPSVFLAAVVGAGLTRLGQAALVAGLVAAVILLPATWSYAPAFADDLTMAREVVRRQPDNFQGRRLLAIMLHRESEYAAAAHAANEMLDRFGPTPDAYRILLESYLELGDGRRALQALAGYESTVRSAQRPSLAAERRRAEALMEQQRRRRAPHLAPPPGAPTPTTHVSS